MTLEFNNVLPIPLASMTHSNDSMWKSKRAIQQGQKVIIEAQSGRGKSTLIHLLYAVRKDYTGEILVDHKRLTDFSMSDWVDYRSTKVSIVFQDLHLFPHLTVKENLVLKNNLTHHLSEDEIVGFVQRVGLEDKLNERCGILSMGQQQRVAIIRALCQPFSYLLMDEPFSHLDEVNSGICMEMINEVCVKQHAGWIMTSLGSQQNIVVDQFIQI